MTRRPCIEGGCTGLAPPGQARCPNHERQRQQRRNAARPHYGGDWERVARAAVDAHRTAHGNWCPGWNRDPHPAGDLTVDHIDPRSRTSGLRVLCRSCNSRRGNRPD